MYAKFINIAITAILMGLATAACAETNADLRRLIGWFGGEWDNQHPVAIQPANLDYTAKPDLGP